MSGSAESLLQEQEIRAALDTKIRQQAIISFVGQKALVDNDSTTLAEATAAMAAEGLNADAVAIIPTAQQTTLFRRVTIGLNDEPEQAPRFIHAEYTIETNEPVLVVDYETEARFSDELIIQSGMHSGVCVVIRDRTSVFGVLGVFSATPRGFDSDDVHFLQSLAHIVATALQRKIMQAALQRSEELYRSTVTALKSGIMVQHAKTGAILLSNDSLKILIEGEPEDILLEQGALANSVQWFSGKGQRLQLADMPWRKAQRTGTSIENITIGMNTQLGRRWLLVNSLLVEGDTPHNSSIVTSFSDITPLRTAAEQLQRFNEELEQRVNERTVELREANKELESFTYSVSHDLQSPLRAIEKFAHIATMVADDPKELEEVLATINAKARRSQELIKGLLAFSRISRNRLAKRMVDMNVLLNEVIAEVRADTERSSDELIIELTNLPPLYADYNLLRHVWVNLCSNAVKFSRQKTPAVIRIEGTQHAAFIRYRISDNGAGFDEKYAHKLFEVFQRLHSEDQFEGTGVGLAIVHRIISRHEGTISATGKSGEGAVFTLDFPIIEPESEVEEHDA